MGANPHLRLSLPMCVKLTASTTIAILNKSVRDISTPMFTVILCMTAKIWGTAQTHIQNG